MAFNILKYQRLESKLKTEFQKISLAVICDHFELINLNFTKLYIDFFSNDLKKMKSFFFRQEFYTFLESLFKTESKKLILHVLFNQKFNCNIDWEKCSEEKIPYFIIDIYGNYLNWNKIIINNDINELPDFIRNKYYPNIMKAYCSFET